MTSIPILAPIVAQLIADAIARHKAGAPQMTLAEISAKLAAVQTDWEKDKADGEALLKEGHE